jgi:hypothetical protein
MAPVESIDPKSSSKLPFLDIGLVLDIDSGFSPLTFYLNKLTANERSRSFYRQPSYGFIANVRACGTVFMFSSFIIRLF